MAEEVELLTDGECVSDFRPNEQTTIGKTIPATNRAYLGLTQICVG
jgi:hypothetical protein